jgi:hypothetical protein
MHSVRLMDRRVLSISVRCRSRADEQRAAVHPGKPGPVGRAGRGPRRVDQRFHARVDHPRRRLGGGPPRPLRHAGARQRVAHGRCAHHVARRKLRRARGRALRHQRRLGVLHRRHLRVQRRDLAGVHEGLLVVLS